MCTFGYRMGRIKNIFDIEIEACCFRVISLRWHLYSDIFSIWFDLIRFDFENYKKQCDNCKENKNLRELRELKSFIFLCTHSFRLSASCWLQFGCWFVRSFFSFCASWCCCGSNDNLMTRHISLINCCIISDYVIAVPQSNCLLLAIAPWSHRTRTHSAPVQHNVLRYVCSWVGVFLMSSSAHLLNSRHLTWQ